MLHTLSENFLLTYNIGLEQRSWKYYQTVYLYTFSPKFIISEKFQAFVEIYGFLRRGRLPETSIDGGLSYFINDDFKLDASAGMRINNNTNIKFFGVGASYRLNTTKEN
jgi:hypothetical protein